ncbi:MAG: DegT/DnrJ/EryC1/StrS family aminotransferase [Candidatus Omnitrophica bacterium]|nr:DegT/DnrJ/EryC1/StrS family aminotransferase [Candidatus Omnitrophota bacterium]
MDSWKIPWSGKAHDFTDEEISFIVNVMKTADPLTQGKYLKLFEEELTRYLGADTGSVCALNSATSALELVAAFCGLKEGDEVIVPGHTFTASALPFLRRGARIIWADIDPLTWVISADDVINKITKRTKAIVLVHLYGVTADVGKFIKIGADKKILIVEDAAQAFGAMHAGKRAGTLADFGVFSFHAQKNMTTFGEGGALYVKDAGIAAKVPGMRNFGAKPFDKKEFYWKPAMTNIDTVLDNELPYKFTISEIQCAIGYKLLKRIESLNNSRKARYLEFRKALSAFPELVFQKVPDGCEPSYHLLPAKYEGRKHGIASTRDDLIKALAFEYKVQAIVQYYPLYRYDLYKKCGQGKAECPNTDNLFDNMVSFPFHQWMSDEDFGYMVNSTKKALMKLRGQKNDKV